MAFLFRSAESILLVSEFTHDWREGPSSYKTGWEMDVGDMGVDAGMEECWAVRKAKRRRRRFLLALLNASMGNMN